jgi:1-acyl-sn-glycerol-3-phosphate acyltransferase
MVAATLFLITPGAVVLSPLILAGAVLLDLATRPQRMARSRISAMVIHYLVLEWVGLLAALGLWIATGFGYSMKTGWSQAAHARIQRWWGHSLFTAAQRWLGFEIQLEGRDAVEGGQAIMAAHHASFIDALLPSELLHLDQHARSRHVMKRELSWDPCLGIFGRRLPNHFVDRRPESSDAELDQLESLAATSGGDETLVIFPEGTFRSAAAVPRIMTKLAATNPERARRLDLMNTLPPRPGGLLALMRGAPEADVIFVGHVGFESFGSLREIAANVPFQKPVVAQMWRVPRSSFGGEPSEQLIEIDRHWQAMDDWIGVQSRK